MTFSRRKKVLVTGGNGLVGRAIVSELSETTDFYYVVRNQNKALDFQGTAVIGDLHNPGVLSEINRISPDVIVHCAAQIPRSNFDNDESIYSYNSKIDQGILSIVSELNCWLIYLSTTAVYGMNDILTEVNESSKTTRASFYASQKIDAEQWITKNISKGLVLRINAPYGKEISEFTVLGKFLKSAISGDPLKYHGEGTRVQDFTNVVDIARFIKDLILQEKLKPGIFNIASGDPINMKSLARLIVKISGSESRIEPSGNIDQQESYRAIYSIKKAEEELGWSPKISLSEGIQLILDKSTL